MITLAQADKTKEACNLDRRTEDYKLYHNLAARRKSFDWRKEANGAWDHPVIDQGACGSCYSIAQTYALQSRFNIMLAKAGLLAGAGGAAATPAAAGGHAAASALEVGVDDEARQSQKITLSYQKTMGCSYYNQQCDGGYPELVARHAYDFGMPAAG